MLLNWRHHLTQREQQRLDVVASVHLAVLWPMACAASAMAQQLMQCSLQVEQCRQQMLARIADQKADCEMVRYIPELLLKACFSCWAMYACMLHYVKQNTVIRLPLGSCVFQVLLSG